MLFVSVEKGIDENKFVNDSKRHIATYTLVLVWFVAIYASNLTYDTTAQRVIEALVNYME